MSFDEQLSSLATLSPARLRAMWREVWRRSAPDIGHDLLRRGIAWKIQSRIHGDLPAHLRREVEATLGRLRRGEAPETGRSPLRPGCRLVREWQGRTYQIVVLEEGFEHDGRQYRSLTQIARAITGTHQSGNRFFGIETKPALTGKGRS